MINESTTIVASPRFRFVVGTNKDEQGRTSIAAEPKRRYGFSMSQWIAEEKVVFVKADGARIAGRIAVAAPVVREQDCACEVVTEGLERSYTIFGDSTLQALLLGVRFLGARLHDHLSRGLRVELEGGEDGDDDATHDGDKDVNVIAVLFGPLLRAAGTPDQATG